jgi:polynucleotide 5'-kinase involved in rRNA processing
MRRASDGRRRWLCPKCLFAQASADNFDDFSAASLLEPSMRVLVFGNSGSGKSTFARQFSARHKLKVLDL